MPLILDTNVCRLHLTMWRLNGGWVPSYLPYAPFIMGAHVRAFLPPHGVRILPMHAFVHLICSYTHLPYVVRVLSKRAHSP